MGETDLIKVEKVLQGGDGLAKLAEQNLVELGFSAPIPAAAQAVAVSLAFCQQRELVLMMELNRRVAAEAEATGQSFAEMLFDASNRAIYAPVMKDIDRAHKQSKDYRRQLREYLEEG